MRELQLDRRLLAGIKGHAGVCLALCRLDLEAQPLLVVGKALDVGGEVSRGGQVK